ncbi:MAG: ABC transporter substrate-binding protein [Treponema sp.]|jgi:ABC-type glycerol-3-phosphate transport system substrate-binding protein|nr:ABC transporter substrate-binding protein [Treponema sp.]
MKKLLVVFTIAMIAFSGCQKKEAAGSPPPRAAENKLIVWSFTDELGGMIDKAGYGFKATHPDITIEYSMTPTEQFPSKLDPVLASGQGTPDVFALEDAFVRKYVESGLLLDISDVYNAAKDKLLAYPTQVGSFEGKVYGMSWQATPGALFYRRSLAQKYLGTDDPEQVQAYFADEAKFLETAALLKSKSNGACVVVSTTGDLFTPFKGARKDPWVVNDKLVLDPAMERYMETCKFLRDNGYEGRVGQWSEGWFAGMKGELTDENGNLLEAFSFFLPTWGLHYVLKTNAPDTAGDWAMIAGPYPYRWGGTWIGAWKDTKNPDAAKELIRYLTTDDAFLEAYARESGDVVSNLNVINKIKDNFSEPFLGGQNHYAEFAEMAMNVDGRLTQGTDQVIEGIFSEAVTAYVLGEKTKEQAIADWRDAVSAQLGLD